MSWEAWLTLGVAVGAIALIATERLSAPVSFVGAVTVLLVTSVIDADQALSGFSNPAPLSVAALYVLAAGAEKTGALEPITGRILRSVPAGEGKERGALVRILVPTALTSAFLNNTPIVAMVAPAVIAWCRRTGRAASTYLMPVSFAAVLGGVTTLIGTSTNLVVSGLLEDAGREPMGLFEIGAVGLPVAVVGVVFLILFTSKLLPDRRAPAEEIGAGGAREFTVEMEVTPASALAGRSIADANLRSLQGVFLVEVERAGRRIAPVAPEEVLVEGDRLTFAGNVGRILDLQRMPGLRSAEHPHFSVAGRGPVRRLYEVVVSDGSPLAGTTLKEVGFRRRYGGAVLAIHRSGERIPAKLGGVMMRPGDVLIVLADPGFKSRWTDRNDFLVVAPLDGDTPPRKERSWIVGVVTLALVAVVSSGLLDILEGALLAAFSLVVLGVLSPSEARSAVDVNVVVVIAASFGLGAAMSTSGLADRIAELVLEPFSTLGVLGILLGVLLATMVLTELITNNAAAVLMFPVALAAATHHGLELRGLAIAVALGASASFLSPIGYQTNTMVYGMGGYRFGDFARLGAPLNVIVIVAALLVIPFVWPLR